MSIKTTKDALLKLYQNMLASREVDIIETELVNSGEANFLASSKGHEGSAILATFLQKSDWVHCHYRDKALMLARGIESEMFLYSALAKAESHSHGRQMVSHMSAPELNVLSIVGPVGNNALQAAGIAHTIKDSSDKPIVICSFGDGTSQQGEVLEAIAEAVRCNLPILFFIHNNNLAISTRTSGNTFFSLPDGSNPSHFYSVPITQIDGINPFQDIDTVGGLISQMRLDRAPQIIVFNVDRLDNHSNADDQKLYRADNEIEISRKNDPLVTSFEFLKELGCSSEEIIEIGRVTKENVRKALDKARLGHEPVATFVAEKELDDSVSYNADEYRGDFHADDRLTMLEAMRQVFNHQLKTDERVCLLGEDIEDDKGDVFGITKGLSTLFPGRVKNTALSESTIAGLACGMSMVGKKPVAFIQFADFMPLAYNQIFTEIATMYWRTNGGWQCPVIIFAACGAYRPGLGPFHSQTNEATYAHIPGLDVYMPSNAADAAGMLNAAFKSNRPSVFLYPKKLLNNSGVLDTTSLDVAKQVVPIGRAHIVKSGSDITLVGWGNTVSLCKEAATILETVGADAEVIDLRTIKPYDVNTILSSVEKTSKLIVVHEDNLTCGVGGDIIASIVERSKHYIQVKRITRGDTFTPCNFVNQLEVLPSVEKILNSACEFLDIDIKWENENVDDDSIFNIEVIGASPSDESVLINEIHVKVGDHVKSGDILVDIEASKASGEILSPYAGVVAEINVIKAERSFVGSSLLKLKLAESVKKVSQIKKKIPVLTRKIIAHENIKNTNGVKQLFDVGITVPEFKTGSKKITNDVILANFPEFNNADIVKRTGIETRYWLEDGESIVNIGADVVKTALIKNNLQLNNINLIICATCSPEKYQSPSMACLILEKLYKTYGEISIPAFDLNAACSGYIYALQSAKDYLQTRPNERVLLITAESLSNRVNKKDMATAFLFADAATATIVSGENHIYESTAILNHTHLSAIAENGDVLNVPANEAHAIKLDGKRLFTFAVKDMSMVMQKCCQKVGVELNDMSLIVPHQANQRIINAIEHRLHLNPGTLYSNITHFGNTSSCTIPIALSETIEKLNKTEKIALAAFGGGFTSAAAILTKKG